MIVSVSRRCDIPSFGGDWFIRRLRRGYCEVPNPRFPEQLSRVSLLPEDVDCFVFWTRCPESIMPHLDELDDLDYPYYFLYTVLDYPPSLEPYAEPLEKRIALFTELSKRLGPKRMAWRYDPIVLTAITDYSFHIEQFSRIASLLSGFTDTVIVSFYDSYPRADRRLRAAGIIAVDPSSPDRLKETLGFLEQLKDIAEAAGMKIQSCAEKFDTETADIPGGACIDPDRIEKAFGIGLRPKKDKGQRKLCNCITSRDIGTYASCGRGCLYCYAC